ncbi:MAG: 4-alpha-glucanotransferase, partial [Myxococcales bacterium]
LPGPHGSGDLGPEASAFAEWLARAGQRIWQMLPVVPPAGGNSPYQSDSAFAGDPNLISLELLHSDGLLSADDVAPTDMPRYKVDFPAMSSFRADRLRRAFEAFRQAPGDDFFAFCEREKSWLEDYSLFRALKNAHGGQSWVSWGDELRTRQPDALRQASETHREEIRFQQFLQYQFDKQWRALQSHCRALGVALVGDIPIFVAHDSADVWQRPELFFLDEQGQPTVVAGVPPDYFSPTGQRWGNVLYRWDVHQGQGFDWWLARFRAMYDRFDAVRVDHFIGFHRYWEIDADSPVATKGRYRMGPGAAFFGALEQALGKLPLIAEDLGVVTPEIDALRERFGFPGMKVLQFAFSAEPSMRSILPFTFQRNSTVYTGTHDNNTSRGWYDELVERATSDHNVARDLAFVHDYLVTDGTDIHWSLIRLALSSQANIAILPVQDLLGLDATSRMNTPGLADGNWSFRLKAGSLNQEIQARLRRMSEVYGRTRS